MTTHNLTKEQVTKIVDDCFRHGEAFILYMDKILKHEMWKDLGYKSFHELTIAKGLGHLALSAGTRQRAIEALQDEGVSNKQIAEATGVSESTVHRAKRTRRGVSNGTPKKNDIEKVSNGTHKTQAKIIEGEIVLSMPDRLARDWEQFDQTLTDAIRANMSWRQVAGILGLTEEEALRRYQIKYTPPHNRQ